MHKILTFIFGVSLILLPLCGQAQEPDSIENIKNFGFTISMEHTKAEMTTLDESNLQNFKNHCDAILAEKSFNFNIVSILRGILGMLVIIAIAWLFSTNRKAINWSIVGKGLLIQIIIAVSVLLLGPVQEFFNFFGKCFIAVLDWTKAGSEFLFGSLVDMSQFGYIFALQILPTIVFFSALMSLLFYLGIVQKIV